MGPEMNAKVLTLIVALVAAGLTWWIEGMRWDKDVAVLRQSHSDQMKAISDKAFFDLAAANKRTADAQNAAAALDKKHTEELANELAKNEDLRADVVNGTRRVRIAAANLATCQLTAGQHSGTGGMGDAAQIELSGAGGRAVLDLRSSAIKDDQVIQYLQGYAAEAQKRYKIN